LSGILQGLRLALKVTLRRSSVFLSISTVVALSTVITLALLAAVYPQASQPLLERMLRPVEGLGVSVGPGDARLCWALVGGVEAPVLVADSSSEAWRVLGVKPLMEGEAVLGSLLASKARVGVGDVVEVEVGGLKFNVRVASVKVFNSFLDSVMVAGLELPEGLDCINYRVVVYDRATVASAASSEAVGALTQWYALSLVALAIASTVVSLKAYRDLEGEVAELEAQGLRRLYVALAVSLSLASASAIGFSYGFVLYSIAVSTLGSRMGVYLPPPPLTQEAILRALAAPFILVLVSSLAVGVALWRFGGLQRG